MNALGADANAGVEPVRPGYALDEHTLQAWLSTHIDGYCGPLAIAQFKGGQSNPTYLLSTPGRRYVLRRKPPGEVLKGAHAVEREARVIAALSREGFAVPPVLGVCVDETVIGSSFFVMDMISGRIFWDATFPGVPRAERATYFDEMNSTIARLHSFNPVELGLETFGRQGSYFARQLARWSSQYLNDVEAGRDPDMDRLIEWLPAHIPDDRAEPTSLIHGDFRCDNLIFHPTEPRILAVLDWELSTLGHPLADFTYHALMYRMPPNIIAGLVGTDLQDLGIPSETQYVQTYCRLTGRAEIPNYNFYITFNLFRIAAIFHGIKGRVLRGSASSAHARERAASFPRLAQLARQSMEACG